MRTVSSQHSLATLLLYCERKLLARLTPHLDRHDLTFDQWRIVSALYGEDGLPMVVLAEASLLPPSSLTRNIDRLVQRGIVVRSVARNDGRKVVTFLSPAGRRIAEDLREREHDSEQELRDGMGPEQIAELRAQLTALADTA